MRKEYDFTNAIKNPYVSGLKKQISIRLDTDVLECTFQRIGFCDDFIGMGNNAIGFNRLGCQSVLQVPNEDQGNTDKKETYDETASNAYSFGLAHIGTAILLMREQK